eukprot:TRINITY_DN19846_c0_g1_i1.p2 TRINITY_DN19846_c0_g1~~TRINITY_DN19846_c0_g1_i1.p2  ORF type:complete len:619 (+),score=241.61 TRINITY_DN19846_c0_g1_i1:83-1939(+)
MDTFAYAAAAAAAVALAWAVWVAVQRRLGVNPLPPPPAGGWPAAAVEEDEAARGKVLKAVYSARTLPKDFAADVVVVGSGIGGLTVGVLAARSGKRVAVLEQHDQAGGCCHTFYNAEYEFDSGVHYIGAAPGSQMRLLFDLLTEGRVGWAALAEAYDVSVVGGRPHPHRAGWRTYRDDLVAAFPDEAAAIDKYMGMLRAARNAPAVWYVYKTLPKPLAKLLAWSGLLNYTPFLGAAARSCTLSLADALDGLTSNKALQARLAYIFGDYGVPPKDASFAMHALVVDHYMKGAYYPVGGGSEIAYQLCQQITARGGVVLTHAEVAEVVVERNAVTGVRMARDGRVIACKEVVSAAGVHNTYKRLCPQLRGELEAGPLKEVQPSVTMASLFVGLEGSAEELGIASSNYWVLESEDIDGDWARFDALTADDVADPTKTAAWKPPVTFICFPSSRDPVAKKRNPKGTTVEVFTPVKYEWFQGWRTERVHKRGADYEALKRVFADKMWATVLKQFPQFEAKMANFDAGTPLSFEYYLASEAGAVYGLEHTTRRFAADAQAELRPETSVRGLYLTGQDVFSCGIGGAMFGGILAASALLGRNLMLDIGAALVDQKRRAAQAKKTA